MSAALVWIDPAAAAALFVAACVLAATPGPDILYVITRGAAQGRLAGVVAAAGLASGCLVHTAAAALGVAAALQAVPAVYTAITIAGAAYVAYLGVRMLLASRTAGAGELDGPGGVQTLGAVFRQSVVMNLLNPKVMIFFLAFLPSFADESRGGVPGQMVQLGLVFALSAVVVMGSAGLASGTVKDLFVRTPGATRVMLRVAGAMLLSIAAWFAWGALH